MTTEKRYEILNALPTYGPMYVPVTDNGEPFYSEGFPVRFYRTDGTEWVANFQPGWTDLKKIIEFDKTQNLLIIACGTCYIMNQNETKPIQVFGVGYSNIFSASNDRLVLQDQTDLTIIEPDGNHWHTERISWDGLKEIKVENSIITGLSYDPMHDADEWVPFSYDIDTKVLTGGSYHRYDNKKPWWKLW
ncbi:hypothetical protein [Paracnuella aquatica]|uniref:hypothetical protein n=1 Tax=Paracnuella aquatica TaxID=2268757 RepID=UPI000F4E7129|nr:hypothetical protein [Paracnuella aquatica]RPD45182.1 hypothetical protein DRJ53_16225 [Paracnuella aquatica]